MRENVAASTAGTTDAGRQALARTTAVNLTDDELTLLDGQCSEKVQAAVEGARARIGAAMRLHHLTPIQAGFIADVVTDAIDKGRLRWSQQWIRHCPIHQESAGYFTFKSGPRRGEPNYKKPKGWQGVDLADRFVTVRGHVAIGGCNDCVKPLLPDLIEALRGVPAEVPDVLRAEGEPKRKRHGHRLCSKCGWRGHEGEMGKLRTLMGDGLYPGKCPSCGVENLPLGTHHVKSVDGFTIVEEAPAARRSGVSPSGLQGETDG